MLQPLKPQQEAEKHKKMRRTAELGRNTLASSLQSNPFTLYTLLVTP